MRLRNLAYDQGLFSSRRFALPVIAVGNLTVGGTGKTPHVEYLLRLLKYYKVATLSRGYKRQSRGFILADHQATAALLGDEPYQYHLDYKDVEVAVCEDRVKGIEGLLSKVPGLQIVILDDAMQHRPVQPSLNLLITDYNRPFYRDAVLPAGRLREPRSGARRANAVIVSKCPTSMSQQEREQIVNQVGKYASPGTPVFFSGYRYGKPVAIGNWERPYTKVVLLTGIANAEPLKEHLSSQGYTLVKHFAYPDHHHYTAENLRELQALLQQEEFAGASVMTTRKDAVKLTDTALNALTEQLPVFFVPIEVQFLANGDQFDELVLEHVRRLLPV